MNDNFIVKLFFILFGYSCVIIPIYCFVRLMNKNNLFFYKNNIWSKFLKCFTIGHPEYLYFQDDKSLASVNSFSNSRNFNDVKSSFFTAPNSSIIITKTIKKNFIFDFSRVLFYFCGIQLTLVTMGFFQERLITQRYFSITNPIVTEKFDDAQFLVFANRIVGCFFSGIYLFVTWKRQPLHIPPIYVHSFTSISNTISSWCQYEALKYVSFPTQTVCKASKIIPTMLMGRIMRKEHYSKIQYTLALFLAIGASIFFFSINTLENNDSINLINSNKTKISGIILMFFYLLLDAFTPNYQKKLMEVKVSCSQMMFYVNTFSVILCFISLIQQSTLFSSVDFIFTHYQVLNDCLILSLGSTFGQIFIYLTIEEYGPVVLSVMMTLRQIFSIVISSYYFSHSINLISVLGLFIVFSSIFADIYRKYWFRVKSSRL